MGTGSVAALMEGAASGYEMTGRVMRDSELAKIALAKPTGIGDQVGFSFLGKTYGAMPDENTISRDRQLAMAGVFDKFGEVQRGSELRQSVRRDEIADQGLAINKQRFEWEKQQMASALEDQQRVKAMNAELQQVFMNSPIGQRSQAYAAASSKAAQDRAAYDAAVAAGDRNAVPPAGPVAAPPSVGEAMLLNAQALAVQAKYGKASPESFLKLAELGKHIGDEGYGKALTMAQGGAPLTQVVSAFNASGQMKIDPNSIVGDKMVDRNGVKSRLLTFKAPDGSTQTIDTLAELDALGKADKIFTRTFQANADRRGASADARGWAAEARHKAEFDAGAGERAGKAALGNMQAELLDPKTTPERAAEIRNRLASLKVATSGGGEQPAVVKLAESAMQSGMFSNMRDALQWANGTKDATPERLRAEFYGKAISSGMSPQRARAAADAGMAYMFPDQAGVQRGSAVPPPEQRKIGGTYMTPKGAMTWRGNGWEPAR